MECELIINPDQITLQLDSEDKQALAKIRNMFENAGLLASLTAATHVLAWADMEVGLVTVGTEDWNQLGNAIAGIGKLSLIGAQKVSSVEWLRHSRQGTKEQERFWANFNSIVTRKIKGLC